MPTSIFDCGRYAFGESDVASRTGGLIIWLVLALWRCHADIIYLGEPPGRLCGQIPVSVGRNKLVTSIGE